LALNPVTGIISGITPQKGEYQLIIQAVKVNDDYQSVFPPDMNENCMVNRKIPCFIGWDVRTMLW